MRIFATCSRAARRLRFHESHPEEGRRRCRWCSGRRRAVIAHEQDNGKAPGLAIADPTLPCRPQPDGSCFLKRPATLLRAAPRA
jgi:hypothetical protein